MIGIGDGGLFEEDETDELEEVMALTFLALAMLRLERLFQGDFELLEDDDDEYELVRLCFSFFFGDLEGLCERSISSLSTEGCLTKTPASVVESFFLSLLLSAIIWYKQ